MVVPATNNKSSLSTTVQYRYNIALLYLEQADYDLDEAVEACQADERWEKEHPMGSDSTKSKLKQSLGRRKFPIGGGIVGQLS